MAVSTIPPTVVHPTIPYALARMARARVTFDTASYTTLIPLTPIDVRLIVTF
jgi:hypothetical protein